jgi:hypothetical protein
MLTWHHTELGRRTACGRYHLTRNGEDCRLFDADWNELGVYPSIDVAQRAAEQLEARARRRGKVA